MPPRLVVDTSVTMAWCFEDEASSYTDGVLDAVGNGEALVPPVWPLEVGNVLVAAERRGRLSQADSVRFIALLLDLPIVLEPAPLRRTVTEIPALARSQGLSTYDSSYLELAMRHGLPLATQDEALRKAAKRVKVHLF